MKRSLALTLAGGAAGAALSLVGTAAIAAPPSHTWGNPRDGEKGYVVGCVIAREFLDAQGACLELFQGLDGPYDLDHPWDTSPNDEGEGDNAESDDGESEEPAPPAEGGGGGSEGGAGGGSGGGGFGGGFIPGGGGGFSGGGSPGTVTVGEPETIAE